MAVDQFEFLQTPVCGLVPDSAKPTPAPTEPPGRMSPTILPSGTAMSHTVLDTFYTLSYLTKYHIWQI